MNQKSILIALTIALVLMVNFGWIEAKRVGCASFGHSCYGGHGKRSDLLTAPPQELGEPSETQQQQQTILRMLQRRLPPSMEVPLATTNEFQIMSENEKELKLTILAVLRESIDDAYRRMRDLETNSVNI